MSGATLPLPSNRYAAPALLLGAVSVGCAPILVRVSEVGPSATAFWRVALSLGPLLVIAQAVRRNPNERRSPRSTADRLVAATPGFFLGAELVVWHLSLHMTSVANATLLVNMTPVFTALIGWVALRQPVGRATCIGIGLAVLGVAALTSHASGAASPSGDAVALLAAVIYAGYFLTLGRARRAFSASDVMLWSTLSASAATLPLALTEPAILPATALGWASLLALAWIVQATGQGLVTFAIAWVSATLSSLTMLIQPVVAAALAWIILGERLGPLQIAGGLMVILGVITARRGLSSSKLSRTQVPSSSMLR